MLRALKSSFLDVRIVGFIELMEFDFLSLRLWVEGFCASLCSFLESA